MARKTYKMTEELARRVQRLFCGDSVTPASSFTTMRVTKTLESSSTAFSMQTFRTQLIELTARDLFGSRIAAARKHGRRSLIQRSRARFHLPSRDHDGAVHSGDNDIPVPDSSQHTA